MTVRSFSTVEMMKRANRYISDLRNYSEQPDSVAGPLVSALGPEDLNALSKHYLVTFFYH